MNSEPETPRSSLEPSMGSVASLHLRLIENLAPPSILVDEDFVTLHLSEGVGRFLLHAAGTLSRSITQLVRPELRIPLENALRRAFDTRAGGLTAPIPMRVGEELREVTVGVWPRTEGTNAPRLAVVVFMDDECVAWKGASRNPRAPAEPHDWLRDELRRAREELRALRETHETASVEYEATNQELQTLNEEYASIAEELRYRKAELQHTNEALEAVNEELRLKLDEVSGARGDLENLMVATDIGTLFLDTKLRIRRFTPRTKDFFRIVETDRGRRISDLRHDLMYDGLTRDAQRVLQTQTPLERESRSSSGGWVLIRMRPYRTLEDVIDGVVVTFVDLTERKATEEALDRSRERLREELRAVQQLQRMTDRMARSSSVREALDHVLETAADLVGIRSIAVYLVDDGARVLRLQAHRGLGTTYIETLTRIDLSSHGAAPRAWRERRRIEIDDLTREPKDPSLAYLAAGNGYRSVQATPLVAPGDVVLGVFVTHLSESRGLYVHEARLLDLIASHAASLLGRLRQEQMLRQRTQELREHEAQLRVQTELLRQNDRRKTEFLSMLSHELRNPLAVVRNTLSHLRETADGSSSSRFKDIIAMLDRQSAHMTHLVSDLLDVARINNGKITLSRTSVALSLCLQDVVAALEHKLRERNIDLRLELESEGTLNVDGDRDRLLQILENLVSNAIKFSHRGGTVRVLARRDGNDVVTQVIDQGVGIPREALQDIFLPFVQVGSFDRTGLGVGLALVRNLVELHDGEIQVESDGAGRGATFAVRLRAARTAPQGLQRGGPMRTAPRRILIVDDNEDAANSFSLLLQARGHDVECAYDGEDAEILAKEKRPEIVFLDLGMPKMDGYELASRLRRTSSRDELTLVAVSGHVPDHRFRASGLDHHMLKPVNMQDVEQLLSNPRSNGARPAEPGMASQPA